MSSNYFKARDCAGFQLWGWCKQLLQVFKPLQLGPCFLKSSEGMKGTGSHWMCQDSTVCFKWALTQESTFCSIGITLHHVNFTQLSELIKNDQRQEESCWVLSIAKLMLLETNLHIYCLTTGRLKSFIHWFIFYTHFILFRVTGGLQLVQRRGTPCPGRQLITGPVVQNVEAISE